MAESRIKLRCGDVLVVDSSRGATQLNALRRFLAEGFQAHLQHNTLLHQVCTVPVFLRSCTNMHAEFVCSSFGIR